MKIRATIPSIVRTAKLKRGNKIKAAFRQRFLRSPCSLWMTKGSRFYHSVPPFLSFWAKRKNPLYEVRATPRGIPSVAVLPLNDKGEPSCLLSRRFCHSEARHCRAVGIPLVILNECEESHERSPFFRGILRYAQYDSKEDSRGRSASSEWQKNGREKENQIILSHILCSIVCKKPIYRNGKIYLEFFQKNVKNLSKLLDESYNKC